MFFLTTLKEHSCANRSGRELEVAVKGHSKHGLSISKTMRLRRKQRKVTDE